MGEPLASARVCPPELMPRSCASAAKQAAVHDWDSRATVAVADDGTWSVLLRLRRDTERLSALWDGPDRTSMGFYRAWHRGTGGDRTINYTQFLHVLKGTQSVPTAKAQEAEIRDQAEMLGAIQVAMSALGASPVRVYPTGEGGPWCKGHVMMGSPAKGEPVRGRVRCSRPADHQGVLCSGPCEVG